MKRFIGAVLLAGTLVGYGEGFEGMEVRGFERQGSELGEWAAQAGHVEVLQGHARSGEKSLRIQGGEKRTVELALGNAGEEERVLSFWAERWTRRGSFEFRIEAGVNGQWEEIYQGDKVIRVGGFLTLVEVVVPKGTERLKFWATSPGQSGVMLDDLRVEKLRPMKLELVTTVQPVIPVLIRKKDNPVLGLKVVTSGRGGGKTLTALKLDLEGTSNLGSIKAVRVLVGGDVKQAGRGEIFGEAEKSGDKWLCEGEGALVSGENFFWISVELEDGARLDEVVDARVLEVKFDDGTKVVPEVKSPKATQRVGYALRLHGDDGSKAFRIPGLATTNKGTLIGVYDVRYRSGGDLPGDIDVGMSRSTDGGQSWEPMKVIMDMGNDPKWRYDGVGDPAVLVDRKSGRIWVAGTWSHGDRSWRGSGQGLTPEETGQLMLVWSDDDGVTWSKPRNITKDVKKPEWYFLLQGPGAGITMTDGTLVFAAQYQDGDKDADGSKRGTPFSTILYSRDQGESWKVGSGIKSDTTEAQVVELDDGSLMLNCRDNRGGARTVGVTKDLGTRWTMHPSDRKALNEPVCMASLLRMGDRLIFSNPNTRSGRYDLAIKISEDDGMTWPEKWHTVYDARMGNGYSCLAPIGEDHVGVLYEGATELFFLRFPLDELAK
ncbi:sialidase family protein [Verrucomicrobiaceae bacterium 227]